MAKTNVKQHVDSAVFARSVLQQRYLDAGRRIKDQRSAGRYLYIVTESQVNT